MQEAVSVAMSLLNLVAHLVGAAWLAVALSRSQACSCLARVIDIVMIAWYAPSQVGVA